MSPRETKSWRQMTTGERVATVLIVVVLVLCLAPVAVGLIRLAGTMIIDYTIGAWRWALDL